MAKDLQLGPYANLPGTWRRVVARWDLGILPTDFGAFPNNAHYRMALTTDPHLGSVGKIGTTELMPRSMDFMESRRGYRGVKDGNLGMIWSFGEVPILFHGDPLSTVYPLNFNNHEAMYTEPQYDENWNIIGPSALAARVPELPFPYPLIQPGGAYPVMRLNSAIDNLVVQLGWGGGSDGFAVGRQSNLAGYVQGFAPSSSRRYNVTAPPLPLREPRWSLDPKLPAGAKLARVGARIYDLPFLHGTTDLPPWQIPRVDFEVVDSSGSIDLEQGTATAASSAAHGNYVYTSPAWRRPLRLSVVGPNTRLRLVYRAEDARGVTLNNWKFNDIPWIEEVSWSYIPQQIRFLSFQWDE